MKLASFFVLSLGLHAAALVYPVSFYAPNRAQFIQVTILPIDQEAENGAGGKSASATPVGRGGSKSKDGLRRIVQPEAQSNPISNPEPPVLPVEAALKVSPSAPVVSAIANSEANGAATLVPIDNEAPGYGAGASENGGIVARNYGTDSGQGNGQSSSGNGSVRTQARYRDTPKPIYPETARREGREGRVVLRVLIDNQGKTKSVELNTSSGSQALDQAATEAIKRWRFHPAYAGNMPVDSWVNVPIDFRLTDARN
jgi:periplasmic protein TonB